MPEKHARLSASWLFTRKEFEQMTRGLIPEQMEDKWFIYFEDNWLYFHRSWTGYCIFQVKFRERDEKKEIDQILVSRDVEQYRDSSDEHDLLLLKYLIDSLLLWNEADFPLGDEADEVTGALHQHHLVGRGRKLI